MAQTDHQIQEYWLPGFGLSRRIVIGHINYFLGPSARVRAYNYQGRDGYLIIGMTLTRDQIEDLRNLSQEYERQETIRMTRSDDLRDPYINEPILADRRTPPEQAYHRGLR